MSESKIDMELSIQDIKEIHPAKRENKDIFKQVMIGILRFIGLLTCLYFFVVSLDLMSSGFRLLAGKKASEFLSSKYVLQNPVTGLVIGVIVTVLVQSSSTSTSIIVSMVGAKIMTVNQAIPVIMGANIGTSITSTFVSLSQVNDLDNFRRAFAGATIHDCFNLLSVIVLLPLEIASGYLEVTSGFLVKTMLGNRNSSSIKEPEILTALTKPLSKLIIELDKKALNDVATSGENSTDLAIKLIKKCSFRDANGTKISTKCPFIFSETNLPEWGIGLIMTLLSLLALTLCLVGMVKILSGIFKGPVARVIMKTLNNEPKNIGKYFTGTIALLVGTVFTILVQSSSVFTSTLVPLVGLGIVSLERVLPMVLGSNIGTTFTGILAALSSSYLDVSLQIALCHTIFNVSGIIIWYPVPYLRRIPIRMATFLGETSAKYRWFAVVYIFGVFIVIPFITFGFSVAGLVPFVIVLSIILSLLIFVVVVNILQKNKPNFLPKVLKNWEFLPIWFRSLEPYDKKIVSKMTCCNKLKCCKKKVRPNETRLDPIIEEELNLDDNDNEMKKVVTRF